MNRTVVVAAATIQAGAALALIETHSFETAVRWAGLLGGFLVGAVGRRRGGTLRDGFFAGMLATGIVVAGYYALLGGVAVEMAAVEPNTPVIAERGQVATVDRRFLDRFPGSALLVGLVTAPVAGFANAVSATVGAGARSRIEAFRRGVRDAR